MYDEIASKDIALTLLILFASLFTWILVMKILTRVKRRRKRRAIEYGIKDFMRQVRG
jgi:predicted permease